MSTEREYPKRRSILSRGSGGSLRWRILGLILLLNLLLTAGFSWWGWRTEQRLTMDAVNGELLTGALVLREYLSDQKLSGEFHDLVFEGLVMSNDEAFRTMRPLYDIARERDFAYFYTVVEKDGTYRFVVEKHSGNYRVVVNDADGKKAHDCRA